MTTSMDAAHVLLIADDDSLLRAVVKATLADERFRQVEATNGLEALALARQEHPDVVILDLDMPGMNGIDVCHNLREDPTTRDCFIVLLTGSDNAGDKERALSVGANTFLSKPFSPLQLMELIDSTFDIDASSPQPRTPETRQQESHSISLAAFMFADVRGFTQFTRTHGDEAALALVRAFQRLMRLQSDTYTGREINTSGDNMLIAFPTARQAVRAAISLMEAVEAYNQSEPPYPFQVGVGIDVGEPVYADGDFIGNTLNKASRLTSKAGAGQILITPVVKELVSMTVDVRYEHVDLEQLRGLEETIQAYEVRWKS